MPRRSYKPPCRRAARCAAPQTPRLIVLARPGTSTSNLPGESLKAAVARAGPTQARAGCRAGRRRPRTRIRCAAAASWRPRMLRASALALCVTGIHMPSYRSRAGLECGARCISGAACPASAGVRPAWSSVRRCKSRPAQQTRTPRVTHATPRHPTRTNSRLPGQSGPSTDQLYSKPTLGGADSSSRPLLLRCCPSCLSTCSSPACLHHHSLVGCPMPADDRL